MTRFVWKLWAYPQATSLTRLCRTKTFASPSDRRTISLQAVIASREPTWSQWHQRAASQSQRPSLTSCVAVESMFEKLGSRV